MYKCAYCAHETTRSDNLGKHMRVRHEAEIEGEKERKGIGEVLYERGVEAWGSEDESEEEED